MPTPGRQRTDAGVPTFVPSTKAMVPAALSTHCQAPHAGALQHFAPGHLSLLAGNVFDCPVPDEIQDSDPAGSDYVCGNSRVDMAFIVSGLCVLAFGVSMVLHWWDKRDVELPGLHSRTKVRWVLGTGLAYATAALMRSRTAPQIRSLIREATETRRKAVHMQYNAMAIAATTPPPSSVLCAETPRCPGNAMSSRQRSLAEIGGGADGFRGPSQFVTADTTAPLLPNDDDDGCSTASGLTM